MNKDNIQLWYPLKNAKLAQGFGENANASYKAGGLIGHTGYDFVTSYNDNVLMVEDGFVYKIINRDANVSLFRAVFQLVELEDDYVLEICYGHANSILVGNSYYKCGIPCITEGNTGNVFTDGRAVSVEARQEGSKAGTHLHIQGRLCKKVKEFINGFHYLSCQEDQIRAFRDSDGYLYRVVDFDNGYNGCIPLIFNKYAKDSLTMTKIIEILKTIIALLKGR